MTQRAPEVTSDDRRAQTATLAQPTRETIARHAVAVPRYTSYPTANHFSAAVDGATHAGWLAALPDAAALSLYAHIPFCQAMCWYCGCSTKAVRRYEPVGDYLGILLQEVAQVASLVPSAVGVAHIHLGGGSPDILKADDVRRLGAALRNRFRVRDTAEVAIEIDPRLLSQDQVSAFAEIGINRASIGVQDFDEDVQKAIGRMQSFDETRRAVEMLRASGITSINLDLVYG
ncbi:MAG: radical SAM protein, partial [Hyphomicrobium sp.]